VSNVLYLPVAHRQNVSREGAPRKGFDEPSTHGTQVPLSTAPRASLKVDAGHRRYGDAPVEPAQPVKASASNRNVPRAHARQPLSAVRMFTNAPAAQPAHAPCDEAPRVRFTVPVGQKLHGSSCWLLGNAQVALENLPVGHSAYVAACELRTVLRIVLNVPVGHGEHAVHPGLC